MSYVFFFGILLSSTALSKPLANKSIKSLVIDDEKKVSVLNQLDSFPNLESLTIHCLEKLETLPPTLGRLKHLKTLDINNGNGCTMNPQLPDNIGDLTALRTLILYGAQDNRATRKKSVHPHRTWPVSLTKLKELTELNLGRNGLKEIPSFVFSLKALESLTLDFNELKDLPDELGKLPHLKKVSIGDNCAITGSIKKQAELKKKFPSFQLAFENEYDCPE